MQRHVKLYPQACRTGWQPKLDFRVQAAIFVKPGLTQNTEKRLCDLVLKRTKSRSWSKLWSDFNRATFSAIVTLLGPNGGQSDQSKDFGPIQTWP